MVATTTRHLLISTHRDVALNIARRLARQYASMLAREDVDGLAMVGLCEAAARFDRDRARPFVAFAHRRIRGAVLDELRRLGPDGRVTYMRRRQVSAARRAITATGHQPTAERVAIHLGLSLATVEAVGARPVYFGDAEIAGLAAAGASPRSHVEYAQLLSNLVGARSLLPRHEAAIIKLHYDLGMPLTKVARALSFPLEFVVRRHALGVALLRNAIWR